MKKNIQEKLLLYRIRVKNDTEAYASLYDMHVVSIYRFVYLKVSHKQDAEDITSDVFLKAWRYLTDGKEKEIKSIRGLLYTIARNRIIDFYRERAKKQEKEVEIEEAIPSFHDLQDAVATSQEVDQLLSVINTLKQEYQEVVLLKYIEGLSTSEIASITGKSKSAIRVTLHRAMKRLKEQIDTPDKHV